MPDGRTERLLRISDWDFNWQDEYEYIEPVDLPKGATLVMRYVYDNSAANPRNPSSPPQAGADRAGRAATKWASCSFSSSPRMKRMPRCCATETSRKALLADVAGEEKRIADVPGDYSVRNSLGVHYVQLGRNDDARAQFLAALELSPDHAVAHYNLGLIAILGNRAEEAFTHLNEGDRGEAGLCARRTRTSVSCSRRQAVPTKRSIITARRSSRGPTTRPRTRTSHGS